MRKRMVSLLLCVVMLAGLLPTTAMAANDTMAFILGVQLEEGYYSTKGDNTRDDGTVIEGTDIDMESRSDTAPEGRNNYLHYQNGVLTIFGEVYIFASQYDGMSAALNVTSGTLTVKGSGSLSLYGSDVPALLVSSSAAINFDLTPNRSDSQLTISSSGNTAVKGDLTISQADRVWITTYDYPYASDDTSYHTIDGSAVIHAENVVINNETDGACVRGDLRAEVTDYLQIINQSETTAALTGGIYELKTDSLNMQSYCGPMVNGDITLSPIENGEYGKFWIDGCTTGDVPVVMGNITVTGGDLSLRNQNKWSDTTDERYTQFKDLKADGPLLMGNLTMHNADGLRVNRQDAGTTPLIRGDLSLTDCADDGVRAAASIDRGYGSGAAVDGDITLQNSSLGIGAYCDDNNVLSTEPGIQNCTLTMKNSVLSVYSFLADWKSINIQDDYLWYVSEYTLSNPTYTKSTDQPLGTKSSTDKAYLEIRSGNRIKTTRAASFSGRITGTALQPVSATAYLNLHGDSYDFRQVPGYQELTMEDEEGEWTDYGIPAGTDLTDYLALETPQGGVHWKLTTAEAAYQDARTIVVTVSGIAGGTNCSEPVNLTISGWLLSSGEDLAVTPDQNGRWDITGSTTQATEYDLWVYGVQVTSRNQADILSNGMASFDPQAGTLFLKNADLQGEIKDPVIKSGLDALTLSATGQNTLRCMEGVVIDAKRLTVMPADAASSLTVRSDQAAAFARNPILPNEAEIWTGDSVDELAYTLLPNYTASKCVKITLHEMQKAWIYDSEKHWHACTHAGCTYKTGMDGHEIEWETEEESYGTTHGVWHKACKVCAYRGASEEMPFFGPDIKTTALPDSEIGKSYWASITAEGSKPFAWSVVSGALPDGLELNTETGEITGKTQKEGTFTFTIKVQGAAAELLNATATYTIKVTASSNELKFVKQVTKDALKNADADSRENIENAIYNLIFKAQFRATGSTGKAKTAATKIGAKFTGTEEEMKKFPVQNKDACSTQVRDDILGTMYFPEEKSAGCMAYALFATTYTYGRSGKRHDCEPTGYKTVKVTENGKSVEKKVGLFTAARVKEFILRWADPGEHIRYNAPHSLVFLGEADANGFYCISYGGGERRGHKPNHTLQVEYRTYASIAKKANGSLTIRDANNGSYRNGGSVKKWSEVKAANKNKKSKTIIRLNCPVEASVSLNGFILDSEYGPFERSFGTVERVGDGIVFTLNYSEDLVLDIRGTGEGTMDAEIEYLDEAGNSLGSQEFDDMPIAPDTVITSGAMTPESVVVLYYIDDGEYVSAWGANLGETATEASDELLSINNTPDTEDEEETPSSSQGDSSSLPASDVSVGGFVNGRVSVSPKTASKGDTVTLIVYPDKGYTLETLTVTDKNGNEIELTDKGDGRYTFKMPGSKVTVKATFMEDNSMLNFFVDVPAGAYYYDAVLWAAENGITGGVDDTHFAPNASCTRAQAVTFLWRVAGSPVPKTTAMPFADVKAGSYYHDAVLWAVENGITKGTSDTTFSPNATCTRAQIVTFLWRSQKFPAADGVNPFTDVAADTYYTGAVLWAAENGITGGTTATTFSPNNDCTRAQIVTFLFRCLGGE